jgi:hypothetical protein
MLVARDILKNLNLFLDGRGHAGSLKEYTAPDMTLATEDLRAGGMDAPLPIDQGMEAMSASFVLAGYNRDALSLWGFTEGERVALTVRAALESFDGTGTAVVHQMRCRLLSITRGAWAPGVQAPLTVSVSVDYFKETHGERVVYEIDVLNMKRIVNGKDQLAIQRAALGL